MYNNLYIWVEGRRDQLFFHRKIKPFFETKYTSVHIMQYSRMKKPLRKKFILSIIAKNDDLIFVKDFDKGPCVSFRKDILKEEFDCKQIVNDNIIIVIKEIEGWYLAGITTTFSKQFNVEIFQGTNKITKSKFEEVFHKSLFDSEINFTIEILKAYSFDEAKNKNDSFDYFFTKFINSLER
jgi:hypothetical protein